MEIPAKKQLRITALQEFSLGIKLWRLELKKALFGKFARVIFYDFTSVKKNIANIFGPQKNDLQRIKTRYFGRE